MWGQSLLDEQMHSSVLLEASCPGSMGTLLTQVLVPPSLHLPKVDSQSPKQDSVPIESPDSLMRQEEDGWE